MPGTNYRVRHLSYNPINVSMVYSAVDGQLLEELDAVKEVIHRYNSLSPSDKAGRLDFY